MPGSRPPEAASAGADSAPRWRLPRRLRRDRLWLEITLALCVKLLLLVAIHHFWFSQPQSKHLTDHGVADALFGPVSFPPPREERGDGPRP